MDAERAGRAHELKQLNALAERAAGGRGAIAVVIGGPGIGKTRLAADALADCGRRGFEAYLAAASEMEQHRPFGLITDALRVRGASDPGRAEMRRLLRGGGGGDDVSRARGHAGVEFLVAEHVVEYVEGRGMITPVVIVLEDPRVKKFGPYVRGGMLIVRALASDTLAVVGAVNTVSDVY